MPGVPMVWAPVHSAWNHKVVISPWMGQGAGASRLLRRKVSELFMIREIPADASGADWPCSQTNDRIFSREGCLRPPVTEWLRDSDKLYDISRGHLDC